MSMQATLVAPGGTTKVENEPMSGSITTGARNLHRAIVIVIQLHELAIDADDRRWGSYPAARISILFQNRHCRLHCCRQTMRCRARATA